MSVKIFFLPYIYIYIYIATPYHIISYATFAYCFTMYIFCKFVALINLMKTGIGQSKYRILEPFHDVRSVLAVVLFDFHLYIYTYILQFQTL